MSRIGRPQRQRGGAAWSSLKCAAFAIDFRDRLRQPASHRLSRRPRPLCERVRYRLDVAVTGVVENSTLAIHVSSSRCGSLVTPAAGPILPLRSTRPQTRRRTRTVSVGGSPRVIKKIDHVDSHRRRSPAQCKYVPKLQYCGSSRRRSSQSRCPLALTSSRAD